MKSIQRDDIHLIARYSDLSENAVDKALHEQVYPKADAWRTFLRLFFLTFGIGFSVMGILFFFAYNWEELHKFIKIGLIEGLLIMLTGVALYPKFSQQTKKIILCGCSLLVGVLFAVFGQVYQTGANAYDFFLAWTIFISIWVLITNFAPLWLFFLALINCTLILYNQQVASDWSPVLFNMGLALLNGAALLLGILLSISAKKIHVPTYFSNIVALAAVSFATIGMVIGIFEKLDWCLALCAAIVSLTYYLGIRYALKQRNGFYLASLAFSIIIIFSASIIEIVEDEAVGAIFVCGFVLASVTFVVHQLLNLQKTKTHGTQE